MAKLFPWWLRIEWRVRRRILLAFVAAELPITVAALTLFGIADPNTYRTKLWQEGSIHGWNSSPLELLYAAANYRPIAAPTPWNQFTTDWNVVISVLSTFILIVKCVMLLTHTFPPLFSCVLHLGLVIVWCVSASLQAASDYSNPQYPSKVPWYLTRSCGPPVTESNRGYCQQAKAAFGVTIIEIVSFTIFLVFSVIMSIPSKEQREKQAEKEQEAREWAEIENFDDKQFNLELDQMHIPLQTPASGMFPAGAGVFQPQQMEQPSTPGKFDFQFGASVTEVDSSAAQENRPNKDLPLRHHFSSDVYA